MQNQSYQVVVPVSTNTHHQNANNGESMTFNTSLERRQFVQLERSKGWEVFLSFQRMIGNKELYAVARRAL